MKFKDMGRFKPGDRVVFTGFSSMSVQHGEKGTVMKTMEVLVEGVRKTAYRSMDKLRRRKYPPA